MQKQAPSLGRILAMVIFAMSCFGLLLYLWLAFGGPVPLKPQSYRVEAAFPEAATLAQEADVRIAGVSVGRVKTKELNDEDGTIKPNTIVEFEIKDEYAPIPANTQAMLRQKTLLGETYVELTPGTLGRDARRRRAPAGRAGRADRRARRDLPGVRQADARGVPRVDQELGRRDQGRHRPAPERRDREPRGLRRRRRRHPRGARRAGEGPAPADQEHRRHVPGAERAHERPPRPDRQLEQRVRGDRLARRGARRDVQHLPDLPRRVEADARAAPGLRERHAPARPGPAPGRRRPRPDGARPRRPRARPREAVQRPRPADRRLEQEPPRGRALPRLRARRRATVRWAATRRACSRGSTSSSRS